MNQLQTRLAAAIVAEDYAKAAKIRDQIKEVRTVQSNLPFQSIRNCLSG